MTTRRRLAGVGTVVVLVAAAVVVGRLAPWGQPQPEPAGPGRVATTPPGPAPEVPPSRYGARPLRATPPHRPTGLRLLVSHAPAPLVVDVDSGVAQPVAGLPVGGDRTAYVEWASTAADAVVVSRRDCQTDGCDPAPQVFRLRRGSTRATRIASALDVQPTRDGAGVWLSTRRGANRCALGQVHLDGRPRRPARPLPCGLVLVDDTPAGLLTWGDTGRGGNPWTALVGPDGTLRRTPEPVDGMAGEHLTLSGSAPNQPITLTDLRAQASFRVPWPSRLGAAGRQVRAHPSAPRAMVGFYDPDPGPSQAFDAWLLDTATRTWRQLPGMPARFGDKPGVEWTADGRLVILATQLGGAPGGGSAVVAVWRPGQPRLEVRELRLPTPIGSGFVVW